MNNQQAFTTAFARLTIYPTGEQLRAARGISMGAGALLAELETVRQMDMPRKEEAAQELRAAIQHALNARSLIVTNEKPTTVEP